MKKGFTLLELLMVISIIVVLAVVVFINLNPKKQIDKSSDSKRKQELIQLSKIIEEFYSDKGCYPIPSKICYDPSGDTTCHICGNESKSPSFSPYIAKLPCDPQHPNKSYLYEVNNITTCPTEYRIYADFNNSYDPAINEVGCAGGCGPSNLYDYGVSSSNTGLESTSTISTCLSSGNCKSYCNYIGKTCVLSASFEMYSDTNCNNSTGGICNGPDCCEQNPITNQVKSFTCFCQ